MNKIFKRSLIKVASVLLSAAMCLSTFVTVSAAGKADYSREIELLKLLNIIDGTVDASTFPANQVINRAEFAGLFAKFANVAVNPSNTLYYNDVPDTHYAYREITALTDVGFLKGTDTKVFNPEGAMKIEYTYALFVESLGAQTLLALDRSVANARSICDSMGVLDGVSMMSGDLTLGDLYVMMVNALFTEAYGIDKPQGVIKQGENSLLYLTRDMIYSKNGIVEAVNSSSIYAKETVAGTTVIDGLVLELPTFDMDPYLGCDVEFIYEKAGSDSLFDGRLVWVAPTKKTSTLDIEVNQFCKYDVETGVLRYIDENDKDAKVEIPQDITVIYNGQYKTSDVSKMFSDDSYSLRLVAGKGGVYTTAIIWDYENIQVSYVNKDDIKVSDNVKGITLSLNPDDYETLKLIDVTGANFDFAGIMKDNIISYYMSEDGKTLKAVVSADSVAGTITGMNDESVLIDGKEYPFINSSVISAYKLGDNVTIFLDVNRKIAAAQLGGSTAANDTVGYLVEGLYDMELDCILFKILNGDGKIYQLQSAEKITINDRVYKANPQRALQEQGVLNSSAATVMEPQIVRYKTNADGKVTKLDFAKEETAGTVHALTLEDDLSKDKKDGLNESQWSYATVNTKRIGRRIGIGDNTKVFIVPESDDFTVDESMCSVLTGTVPGENSYPSAKSYRTTEKANFLDQYVVIKMATGNAGDITPVYSMMFDSSYITTDADGFPVRKVKLYAYDGASKEFTCDTQLFADAALMRGDIVKPTYNPNTNKVSGFTIIYKPANDKRPTEYRNPVIEKWEADLTAEKRHAIGFVYETDKGGIRVGWKDGKSWDEYLQPTTWTVYDSEKDQIFPKVDYTYLKPGSIYGDDASTVVYHGWYTQIRSGFGYR